MNRTFVWIVALLALGVGVLYWLARPSPMSGPGNTMSPPGTAELTRGAAIVDVNVPADLSAEAQIGQRGFEAKCASCHGANAAGQNGIAPPLVHKIYEPSHHGDMAFFMAAQNGVQSHHWAFGDMPPIAGVSQTDVMAITAYVRELQRANGIN